MLRQFVLIVFGVFFTVCFLTAQETNNQIGTNSITNLPFMFSFVPGVSISKRPVGIRVLNNYHVGYLGNYCDNLDGAGYSGLLDIVSGEIHGVQVSGLVNLGLSDLKMYPDKPWTYGKSKGFQSAGILNFSAGENMGWVQFSGIMNGQIGDMSGVQFAGLYDLNIGKFSGAQAAGLLNTGFGEFYGAQVAGLANINFGNFTGAQVAGLVNTGFGDFNGVQVAGLGNVQLGKVKGVQVGLFNFANDVDIAQIGLFNINMSGDLDVDIGYNELNTLSISLRHGTKYVYNIYSTGVQMDSFNTTNSFPFLSRQSYALGMGIRYPVLENLTPFLEGTVGAISYTTMNTNGWDSRNSDLMNKRMAEFSAKTVPVYSVQLGVSFKLFDYFSLIAGVSYNICTVNDNNRDTLSNPILGKFSWSDNTIYQWPGFYAAVRF